MAESYPKFIYNAVGASRLVATEDETADIGPGWFEDPGCVTPLARLVPQADEAQASEAIVLTREPGEGDEPAAELVVELGKSKKGRK